MPEPSFVLGDVTGLGEVTGQRHQVRTIAVLFLQQHMPTRHRMDNTDRALSLIMPVRCR